MPSSNPIELHAAALGLAVLIQAKAKSEAGGEETKKVAHYPPTHKEFLNQPITKVTRQGIHKIVDAHMEGYLFRIDRLEQTAESHGARIKQLEASRKPPTFE